MKFCIWSRKYWSLDTGRKKVDLGDQLMKSLRSTPKILSSSRIFRSWSFFQCFQKVYLLFGRMWQKHLISSEYEIKVWNQKAKKGKMTTKNVLKERCRPSAEHHKHTTKSCEEKQRLGWIRQQRIWLRFASMLRITFPTRLIFLHIFQQEDQRFFLIFS